MGTVTLTIEEAQTIIWASRFLNLYMPSEEHGSGFQDKVMDHLATIMSEIQTPLMPAGSEAFMSDFLAILVDEPLPHADLRARDAVEGARHLRLVRSA